MIAIGLMSGTSADGTEAAVVRIEGAPPFLKWELLQHVHMPHSTELREKLFAAFRPETSSADTLCVLSYELGEAFAAAALEAMAQAGLKAEDVGVIGSHGQTVWHEPRVSARPSTLQLDCPAIIAERTGVSVVSDFRARDIAAGGEGAPLVPYVDWLFLSDERISRAVQNIGGIGNVCYLPAHGGLNDASRVLAFDTGPGNMLMDYAASRATNGAMGYDRDGLMAARGCVSTALLSKLMEDEYFTLAPPKSTGRERFGAQMGKLIYDEALANGLSPEDIIATLTAFTAESIAKSYADYLPEVPNEVVLCGGGALNPSLAKEIAARLPSSKIITSDALGMPSEAKEAIAFAVLAYETVNGRPGNLPAATGAKKPVVLGSITPA